MGKYPNFCRYLHLPIQSGTNQILKKMRRKYTIKEYNDFVEIVAKEVPHACIGTDVIVGFPGESDELFQQTKNTRTISNQLFSRVQLLRAKHGAFKKIRTSNK